MSLRATLVLLVFMLVVATSFYVTMHNQTTLALPVVLPGGYELQVYAVIAWSFVLGFVLTTAFVLVRSSQIAVGRWKEAREARARERIEKRYAQGLLALIGGATAEAGERFEEVLEKDGQHADTLMSYGEMLRGLGRNREAADLHRRAAELRPGDMRPLFELAADWRAEGNLERARDALERAIAVSPKQSMTARLELRDLLIEAGHWDEAAAAQDAVEAAAREEGERRREKQIGLGIRYERGRRLQERGQLKEAEKEYRGILRQDPAFLPASLALGEVLVAEGAAEEGVREWRRGYEATGSPLFFTRFEEHYLGREEPEVIIGLMRALVESSRSRIVPTLYLAKLHLRLEMIDEADEALSSILGDIRDGPVPRYLQGMILERRGRLKEAAEVYRGVIAAGGLLRPRYVCRDCGSAVEEASARCPACGLWSSVDVDLSDVLIPAEERGKLSPEWAAGA